MHVACHHHRAIHCHLFYFSYHFHMILLTCSLNQNHAHICPIMFKWATTLAWGYVSSLWALARIHHHLIDANQHASILSPFRTFSIWGFPSSFCIHWSFHPSPLACWTILQPSHFFGDAISQDSTLPFCPKPPFAFPSHSKPNHELNAPSSTFLCA